MYYQELKEKSHRASAAKFWRTMLPPKRVKGREKHQLKGSPVTTVFWRQCSIVVSELPSLENLHVFHAEVLTLHVVSETETQAQGAPRGKNC